MPHVIPAAADRKMFPKRVDTRHANVLCYMYDNEPRHIRNRHVDHVCHRRLQMGTMMCPYVDKTGITCYDERMTTNERKEFVMRTQLHYYPVENMETDDDDAYPILAWDTKCNAQSAYMMLGRFLHNMYPTSYYMLTNERQMKNSDGIDVTIHDVEYMDPGTGEGIDTIGYVHVWVEDE